MTHVANTALLRLTWGRFPIFMAKKPMKPHIFAVSMFVEIAEPQAWSQTVGTEWKGLAAAEGGMAERTCVMSHSLDRQAINLRATTNTCPIGRFNTPHLRIVT